MKEVLVLICPEPPLFNVSNLFCSFKLHSPPDYSSATARNPRTSFQGFVLLPIQVLSSPATDLHNRMQYLRDVLV